MTSAYASPMPLDVRLMTLLTSALGWVFVGILLAAGGLWAVRHSVWTIQAIEVHGDLKHQNEVTFRSHLSNRLRGSFVSLDLGEVKQVFEGVPWVRSVRVERAFPNRIRVTVEEHQPVAWWGQEGGSRLLNRQGEVFEANADDDELDALPRLIGPDDQARQVKALYERLRPLFLAVDTPLERLELTSQGSWRAVLEDDARLELGRGSVSELEERVNRYLSTVSQVTSVHGRRVLSVDMRYASAYAVRLHGVTTLEAPPATPVLPRPSAAAAARPAANASKKPPTTSAR